MKHLRIFLLDDERPAVQRLSLLLREETHVEVVGTSTNSGSAVEDIAALQPDVLILDVAMPELDGFEVVRLLPAGCVPAIIFMTAFSAHAVRAFETHAVDYLLKPVTPGRLAMALAKARSACAAMENAARLEELRDLIITLQARSPEHADRGARGLDAQFWIHRHREVVRIGVDEVGWVEAEGDYVRFHCTDWSGLMRCTLNEIEQRLDRDTFVRVHRSAIVRRGNIVTMRRGRTGTLTAVLSDGTVVPVGRRFSSGLRSVRQLTDKPGPQADLRP